MPRISFRSLRLKPRNNSTVATTCWGAHLHIDVRQKILLARRGGPLGRQLRIDHPETYLDLKTPVEADEFFGTVP